MQVARWGNSLAVRIPAAVAEILMLREGDELVVRVAPDGAFLDTNVLIYLLSDDP